MAVLNKPPTGPGMLGTCGILSHENIGHTYCHGQPCLQELFRSLDAFLALYENSNVSAQNDSIFTGAYAGVDRCDHGVTVFTASS